MAAPMPNNMPINPDTTMITVKVAIDGTNRRFKLALRDLAANVFPQKLRFLLAIPPTAQVVFERYSDSAGSYVTLDSANPGIYKQLYRAAKAKLKLRIKATVTEDKAQEEAVKKTEEVPQSTFPQLSRPYANYLETVLAPQAPSRSAQAASVGVNLPNTTTETLVAPVKKEELQAAPVADEPRKGPFIHDFNSGIFCIDCNNCGNSIPNEHYHCGICDDGDFDLCMGCVDEGLSCSGDGHWLIKRTLRNGQVISSTTNVISKFPTKPEETKETNEAEPDEKPATSPVPVLHNVVERTCNCCIGEFPNAEFVFCSECMDFDLCKKCLLSGLHGHNPAHTFTTLDGSAQEAENSMISVLCKPGRNASHMAICDECDKGIIGVRHKCLNCPDWDYCSECVENAHIIHPGHRFAPLYEPIPEMLTKNEVHYGIYCDGPLCASKPSQNYIRGARFKCSICHDTDFCANCEACPTHQHNRTHPLIKFKTPVKRVTVTTLSEKLNGETVATLGDILPRVPPAPASTPVRRTSVKTAATETTPVAKSTNAATQVQTMADLRPVAVPKSKKTVEFDARFVTDAIADGTILKPDTVFTQVWTMTNPGPETWPVGCSVRYTGGDWMLNVDIEHPSSVCAIYAATESTATDRAVKPGESFDFEITLRTPTKESRIISYWRLKTAEGAPFGHKLWCDVSVRAPIEVDPEEDKPVSSYVAPSVKEEQEEETAKPQDASGMIFPKLDKESPSASLYESAKGEEKESTAAAAKSPTDDFLEDVESLDLDDEDETEDGFLTDEEYDILDASDEEFLDAAQKATK